MNRDDFVVPEFEECEIQLRAGEGGGYICTVKLPSGASYTSRQSITFDDTVVAQLLQVSNDPFDYGQLLYDTFLSGSPCKVWPLSATTRTKRNTFFASS